MKVEKWEDSLALRLPADVVAALGLKEGDEVSITVTGPGQFTVQRPRTTEEAIEALRKFRGIIPADFKFDRDEANER